MNPFDELDPRTLDRLAHTAADTAAKTFPFLKSIVRYPGEAPVWKVGDIPVTNEEAIARVDEAAMNWARFSSSSRGPVEETPWLLALYNGKPPRPNSFNDKSKWDTWPDGRPKEPWTLRTRMTVQIMTGELAGRVVILNGENLPTRCLIADLQTLFAEKRRRPLGLLTHENQHGEYVPVFKVIRLTEDAVATPGLNHLKFAPDEKPVADETPEERRPPPVNGGAALDDDIPF